MSNKTSSSDTAPDAATQASTDQTTSKRGHTNSLSTQYALRQELGEFMRITRLSLSPIPSQIKLSQDLGYTYSIVTSWENGGRNILRNQLLDWARALGIDTDMQHGPMARFDAVVLEDGMSRPNKGERIERDVNERLRLIRKERKLTLREMAEITGISYSHYARVEHNRGNLSISQLRAVAKQLKISYDYLIDGANQEDTIESLREKIATLTRENELLESFRRTFASRGA